MDICMGLLMVFTMLTLAGRGIDTVKEAGALPQNTPHLVVIDSGHGGFDPGKVGVNQALEKDINLSIAKKLEEKLTNSGIQVIMTRVSDEGLYPETASNKKVADLNERCRIIQESNAEIAVSIHQNSFSDPDVRGGQVFYYKHSDKGCILATGIQQAFKEIVDTSNTREAKSDNNYYMLLHTPCPTVIVECGFLSNPEEAALLAGDEYRAKICQAIKKGIDTYFER
jgi:N-acetylmuramoyl-L-alanine amidase